jgi:hypothetical protein
MSKVMASRNVPATQLALFFDAARVRLELVRAQFPPELVADRAIAQFHGGVALRAQVGNQLALLQNVAAVLCTQAAGK